MIAFESVTRRFGERLVIEDVSLEVRPGEIFALLGPNGAGKTTTLRMMATLIAPSSGTIRIDGRRVTPRTAGATRRRVGLLTEHPGLWERLTVETNLLVYAGLHGFRDTGPPVERALRQMGLWERRGDPVAVLSRGMKQKVALARALLHDPALVLLDEPTAGLDPQASLAVRKRILTLRDEGRTVVVSTHNLAEAERTADRVGVLRHRLMAVGSPEHLRRRLFGHRVRFTLVGAASPFEDVARKAGGREVRAADNVLSAAIDDPDAQVPVLVRTLGSAGAAIRAVEDERPALEDVYLRLLKER